MERTIHPCTWLTQSRILSYQDPKHNNRQQKHSHLIAQCHGCWRLWWRTRRRSPAVRRGFLCWAGIAAEAGPDDSVDTFARQQIDVLAIVLAKGVYVAKRRERAPGSCLTGDRRILGAAEGNQSGGVVPAALRGLCAGPHGQSVQVGVQVPENTLTDIHLTPEIPTIQSCTALHKRSSKWKCTGRVELVISSDRWWYTFQTSRDQRTLYRHNLPWSMRIRCSYSHQSGCNPW